MKKTYRLILSVACCLAFAMNTVASSGSKKLALPQKIAIIDAGSSGSRLRVYEIGADSTVLCVYPKTAGENKKSKGRAISTVVNQEDSVKNYLQQMTANYTSASGSEAIPLYILATAGMRLKDKATTESLYKKMKKVKANINGFKVKDAMTISGRYEGLYAWIAVNYEGKTFASSPKGILEMGGASMQVTFATSSTALPDDRKITRRGWGTIYSKSYLGGGSNEMYANTPDSVPFKFNLPLEDISPYYGNTTFLGCSTGVTTMLDGVARAGSFQAYLGKLPREDKYHRFMMAYYLQWVFGTLHLTGRISASAVDRGWTEGAAYDIVINRQAPEPFDYSRVL